MVERVEWVDVLAQYLHFSGRFRSALFVVVIAYDILQTLMSEEIECGKVDNFTTSTGTES